jgi:hypothetical protein
VNPRDLLATAEVVIERARPAVDSAHWNMLWVLLRDGNIRAGQMVLDSLAKVSKKGDDLVRTLPNLQAWERVTPDRVVCLLEAAKKAALDVEWMNRLERVLGWARNRVERKRDVKVDQATVPALDRTTDRDSAGTSASPASSTTPSVIAEPEKEKELPKVVKGPAAPVIPEGASLTLPVLLKALEDLFKQQTERQAEFQRERDVLREEITRTHADLQLEKELASEYAAKVAALEKDLSTRDRELVSASEKQRLLEKQLAETREEVLLARRHADDYVHEATLSRDNAVRSFQASLWERLKACLVEVLDGEVDSAGLSPDQVFFRHRLQEIRDMLREMGVPPY